MPAKTRSSSPAFPSPPRSPSPASESAVADAEIVVSVVPSEFLRPTFARSAPYLHPGQIVVSATKGVENHTFLRMTQVIAASPEANPDTKLLKSLPRIRPEIGLTT
jgi:glycerol-3-phosphate dehydrogenase (NAD(P)+)